MFFALGEEALECPKRLIQVSFIVSAKLVALFFRNNLQAVSLGP